MTRRSRASWLETLAVSLILQMTEAGEIELIKSPVHFLENSQSPLMMRRRWVEHCIHLARNEAKLDETVKARAHDLQRGGLKPLAFVLQSSQQTL